MTGSFFVSCAIDRLDETCMHYRRQYASKSKIISFTIILIDTQRKTFILMSGYVMMS